MTVILGAGLLALPSCSTKEVVAETRGTPGKYLADFDTSWDLVRDTHYDTEYNGVDWDAVRDELRPMAEQAGTLRESRQIINEMVGRLNQSHFGVIPEAVEEVSAVEESASDTAGDMTSAPVEVGTGDGEGSAGIGADFRVVEGTAMVTSVRSGGPADMAGVRMGWIIEAIRDTEVASIVERLQEAVGEESALYAKQSIDSMIMGSAGTPVSITFLDGSNNERTLDISRENDPGSMVKFGNLPPMSTNLEHRWLTSEETGDPSVRVGYIAFNIFMIPIAPQFEAAMVEYQDADGIIVDLRGNPGGIGAMAGALGRFFVTETVNLGTMQMRGAKLEFNSEPIVVTRSGQRLSPFTGPVAMVLDGTSASTSEVWAGGMRAIGRIKTFGSRTAGMALPASMSKLPSGDVLLHAIADYVNSDGTRLEGDGVLIDVEVPLKRDDLLDGVDAPLREAARWIVGKTAAVVPTEN
ncbi:MAG: S41 family peptidase [Phycisphaerales bacterium]